MTESLKTQLRRQLEFIAYSSEGFDAGRVGEAVRIAVAIRVLFHQTARSHSLVQQLGVRDSIKVLSTIKPADIGEGTVMYHGLGFTMSTGATPPPKLIVGSYREQVSVPMWWNQIVAVSDGVRITRRSVVLMGANKDGGAHVDDELNNAEKILQEGMLARIAIADDGSRQDEQLGQMHLSGLRRFAFEVLNSEELDALAR